MTIPPKISFWLLLLLTIIPGLMGAGIFAYYALIDWAALQVAYAHYEQVAGKSSELRVVFIAEAEQNIHRLNLFADGVWTLLSAVLATIGLHGLCLRKPAV